MKTHIIFAFVLCCTLAMAQLVPDAFINSVSADVIGAHNKFIGSSLLEGRGPGTRGEQIAAAYIEAQMTLAGLTPAGDNGGFRQQVPLAGVTVQTSGPLTFAKGSATVGQGTFAEDFVVTTDTESSSVSVTNSDCVFVGYGISAPELSWDDYKGVQVSGKTLVMLVGQPPSFNSSFLTYYGRWTYKYEEARRRGAAAVWLVHTNATAGYPWSVVISSNTGEQVRLNQPITGALQTRGWITSDLANTLAIAAGMSGGLNDLFSHAAASTFTPVPLGLTFSLSFQTTSRSFEGLNIVGRLDGSDIKAVNESIVVMGHLDHLGIRDGNIYPGYLDNAAGASMTLAVAAAFGAWSRAGYRFPRSLVFMCPTAEEAGLIGSDYYARGHSAYPVSEVVASIAFDVGNAWGKTSDVVLLGAEKSDLGDFVSKLALVELGLAATPDPTPAQGLFFRSDHFSFAKVGIPSLWITTGTHFVGQSDDYYDKVVQGYIRNRYHQPSDAYDPAYTYDGMAQQAQLGAATMFALASDTTFRPECYNSKCF